MKNKALLVGINDYPLPGNDLRGCINDLVDMGHFIANQNKVYEWENIKTITDAKATKKGILEQLDWLLDGASAGDQILFQYSGHGAQQATMHPAIEKDGLDEIICPYDFNDTAATAISDKEFAQRFAKIPEDVHFVWISDSCHAADLSRDPAINNELDAIRFRNFKGGLPIMPNVTKLVHPTIVETKASLLQGALLSGCASHQLSADAFINNRFNGAFTHYLIKNLNLYGHNTSMQKIVQYVNKDLAENGYDQNPKIEGALAQQTFFKQ
jgi:hypothetical protein